MTKPEEFQVKLADPQELATTWMRIFTNGLDALQSTAKKHTGKKTALPYDPLAPMRAFSDLTATVLANPTQMFSAQQKFFKEWSDLWTTTAARAFGEKREPVIAPERSDRRFNEAGWNELPPFDYLKQAYLLASRQILETVASSELDPPARIRADFYARQFINALSPANFAFTNPEAIRKAFETGGVSLLSGYANLLADAASPSGLVKRRAEDNFELGVHIAATPGSIIFQNEMMQLIQYIPTTETVYKRPIMYVPPLVNKYYILDLQPKSSLIKWLVDQGHTVFVISWVNPGQSLAYKGMWDYLRQGPIAALDAIELATGETTVDCFAFCMGGVLLSMTAGYLAATKQGNRMGTVTVIGTLLDTTHSGEWSAFYEKSHFEAFETHLDEAGVMDADKLQALFSVVRSNDLIWSSVVNHYLMDRVAPASDLLFWFADGAHIPKAFLLEYARAMIRENLLHQPGGVVINGTPIDLGKVKVPVTVISLKDDHVSAWQATYDGAKLFGGKSRFVLGGSGHNAGLVNPPAANKHGYWVNDELPETPQEWFDGAKKHEGSWWPNWQQWLVANNGGAKVPARAPGTGKLPVIEAAPGSYVRMQ